MNGLDRDLFFEMLRTAAEQIEAQVPYLNELDSKIGDGDHGTTMHRVCQCIQSGIAQPLGDWSKQVDDLGWAIMSQDGGSAGMLIGNLFLGIASELTQLEISPNQVAVAFRAGVDRMCQFSGAKPGDKTMLDALLPAISALEQQAAAGASLEELFAGAADAAEQGAQATIAMKPTRGRAKNMGEKAIGHIDPGATSMALLFGAFNQVINQVVEA